MKRAALTVKGDVQEVGYRALVMKEAQKLGLTGYVENEPDGSVRIICEGEREAISKLINSIKLENAIAKVESVDIEWTDSTGEFEGFIVNIPDINYELFQGFATARKYLVENINETRKVGEKVDDVAEEVRGSRKDIQSMHGDMNTRFDNLDGKYGEFGKDMKEIKSDISVMKEMSNEVRGLSNQISRLVDYFIEKDQKKA